MYTYRYIVNEIKEALKQSFDDSEIGLPQILYWVTIIANKYKTKHIENQLKSGYASGRYIIRFDEIPIKTNGLKKYIELPISVLELEFDNGVRFLHYDFNHDPNCSDYNGVRFSRTFPDRIENLYWNPLTKPSITNPFYYFEQERLYLLGLEDSNIKYLEGGFISPYQLTSKTSLDDKVDLSDDLISIVRQETINMGFYALQFPKDRTNDGEGTSLTPKSEQKIQDDAK